MDTTRTVGTSLVEPRVDWQGVPADRIGMVWPMLRIYVNEALSYSQGEYLEEDIKECLEKKEMQAWFLIDTVERRPIGAVVTMVVTYPRRKVCDILIGAGERINEWTPYLAVLEDWARSQDAEIMRFFGRRGLTRVLGKFGYSHAHDVCIKYLQTYN